jgi:hypothetical protein
MNSGRSAGMRDVAAAIALMGDLALGMWAGTEWVARRLEYAAVLGQAIAIIGSGPWWIIEVIALAAITVASALVREWRRATAGFVIVTLVCGWLARRPIVYTPWAIVAWHWRFRHGPHLVAVVQRGWEIAAVVSTLCAIATAPLFLAGRSRRVRPTSQGTAAWDPGRRLVAQRGLVVGWQDALTRERP